MRAKLDTILRSLRVLLRLVFVRFEADRCVQVAGSLTFTTLLALVPLFTIAFALFAAFPVFEDWSNQFKIYLLTTLVPEMSGKVITVYMQQFSDNAAKLTAIGSAFLAVTALVLVLTIERVFNVIWRVRRPRPVVQRLVIFWAAITIGPLLIGASLSLTSWLVTQSMSMAGDIEVLESLLLRTVPVLLNMAAFALLYLLLPNRRVALADALIGGAVAALTFELMKRGFGLYVQLVPGYALVYGAFATVPIFLLWIYLSWIVILFGAVVVAVLPRWRMGAAEDKDEPGARFYLVLRLFEALFREQAAAQAPSTSRLAAILGVFEDETERLLERMESERWVRRVEPSGWVLGRDLASVRVADLYRSFVLSPSAADDQQSAMASAVTALLDENDERLNVSVRSLLEQAQGEIQPNFDLPTRTGANPPKQRQPEH